MVTALIAVKVARTAPRAQADVTNAVTEKRTGASLRLALTSQTYHVHRTTQWCRRSGV